MDTRINELASLLVHYSVNVQKGEKVLVSYEGEECKPLVCRLIHEIYRCGAFPYVEIKDSQVMREFLLGAEEEQLQFMNDYLLAQMKGMQAYISISGTENTAELSDVPPAKTALYNRLSAPVLDYRVNKTKWAILRYPNASMAQLAGSSRSAFEDFFFQVCLVDYRKMSSAMDALVDLMEKTDKVRITGPDTDLTFSIRGIPAIKCAGNSNIPDGEVFTAPVRESVNGKISYNTPSEQQGVTFDNIVFEIKDGKIVNASANNTERLNQILDTDEGARYFGEFALGVNPYILHPMKDTLFDEKICGSFHLTPGRAYEEAPNGNASAVHWDLVMIQRPEYGGGEIYFDDVLIRKDGTFVLPELTALNPENLQ